MPSERSLYSKIRAILELAKSTKIGTLEDLYDAAKTSQPQTFITRSYDRSNDEFVEKLSIRAVRRVIRTCRELQLLSDSGSLTPLGREALVRIRFDSIVSQQASLLLRRSGVDFRKLNAFIQDGLRRSATHLPTCRYLWEQLDTKMNYGKFSRLLTLMSHTGAAETSQKKLYLKFLA